MVVDYPGWLWRPILNRILRSRPARVADQYRSIWTNEGSPLKVGTERLRSALGAKIHADVEVAYRYGSPAVAGRTSGALVVPLFPQRTGSTTGTIEALLAPDARILYIPPDDPGYIRAQAELVRRAVGETPPAHLVVSFHGIPVRYDRAERGIYRRDCESTFRALLAELDWPEQAATLTFQSRFGPEPWIGPATAKTLAKLGSSRSVAVVTPGFLTDGLETIEEIGIRGRETFMEAGGERFVRVPCVEDHPDFVSSLARLVEKA
jgi:ferrochelatase